MLDSGKPKAARRKADFRGQDDMTRTTTLPDGRIVHCVNDYEVGFGWHEIVSDDVTRHGLVHKLERIRAIADVVAGSLD